MNPTYTLQLLYGSDAETGLLALERADRFAAIVEALEGTYENSITLSGGDNVGSGVFAAAATDPSLIPVLRTFYEDLLALPAGTLSALHGDGLPHFAVAMAIQNAIGVQASALGTRELDLGTAALDEAIAFTATLAGVTPAGRVTGIGALFPYLSAGLDFTGDTNLAPLHTGLLREASSYAISAASLASNSAVTAQTAAPRIAPWTTITEGGEVIGVLGVTAELLAQSPSEASLPSLLQPGHDGQKVEGLVGILQPQLDQMQVLGINKIILLSHLKNHSQDQQLASGLRGVDIVLSAGRNEHNYRFDGIPEERYVSPNEWLWGGGPTYRTGADGRPVAIIDGGAEFSHVARLVITFDAEGVLIPDPDRLPGPKGVFWNGPGNFGDVDPLISRGYAATDAMVESLWGAADPYAPGTRGGAVRALTEAVQVVIAAKDGNVLGFTDVFLEGRRGEVQTEETNLGNLAADANLAMARQVDAGVMLAFQTGGAIRAEIGAVAATVTRTNFWQPPVTQDGPTMANPAVGKPAGAISQLDVENALRFNNGLTVLAVTAENLARLLEHAVAEAAPGVESSRFPQLGGVSFSFDATRQAQIIDGTTGTITQSGERVRNLALFNEDGSVADLIVADGVVQGDPGRAIKIVTLAALAGAPGETVFGADGFPLPLFTIPGSRVDLLDHAALGTGAASFAAPGSEQDALAEYLLARHGTPELAFDRADSAPLLDERIQNLTLREDTVNTPFAQVTEGGLTRFERMHVSPRPTGEFRIVLEGGDMIIRTHDAAELITGGSGNDTVYAGGGNDRVSGGAGDDMLHGEAGDDRLDGDGGANTMHGGPGNDFYMVRSAQDVVVELPGEGIDQVTSFISYTLGANVEKLVLRGDAPLNGTGNALDNVIQGNDASNTLIGGQGNDVLRGHGGADILLGGEGRDVLDGGDGDDMLFGGPGNDRLTGGAGADELNGGPGRDMFSFNAFSDSTPEAMDVIMDFERGQDVIRLSVIDIGGGDFQFVGMGAFLGGGVASVRYEILGEDTMVFADVGDAELAFRMVGSFTLAASDFLL